MARSFPLLPLLVAVGFSVATTTIPQASGANQGAVATREDRWRADLDVLAREFPERHIDFAKLYPRFSADLDAIRNRLATSSDAEVVLALTRLIASANVGHTVVRVPAGSLEPRRLPIVLAWHADGLGVNAASEPYRDALGLKVVRIGQMTPEALEAAVAPYVAHENEQWLHVQSPSFMTTVEVLRQLGQLGPDGAVEFTFERASGERLVRRVLPAETAAPLVSAVDALRVPMTLLRKQPNSNYWYEYLPDRRALYIQYNRCQNDPAQPFSEFAKGLFAFADTVPIERVIVDLRRNGGGDSRVIAPLMQGLQARSALSGRGRLFTLIGRSTFSSALMAAIDFRNRLQAILVGEPPGERPNSYGEVRLLTLPNSRIDVQYSTKFFRMMTDSDPLALMPDIVVGRTLAEAIAGRDPVLDRALGIRGPGTRVVPYHLACLELVVQPRSSEYCSSQRPSVF